MKEKEIKELIAKYEKKYFADFRRRSKILGTVFYHWGSVKDRAADVPVFIDDSVEFAETQAGAYNYMINQFIFSSLHKINKPVILHEMLHFYQYSIEDYLEKEFLVLRYAEELRHKIKNFDDFMFTFLSFHSEYEEENGITRNWDDHNMFFFFRSLLLDIRLNYPLGTVFGYDAADVFGYFEIERG